MASATGAFGPAGKYDGRGDSVRMRETQTPGLTKLVDRTVKVGLYSSLLRGDFPEKRCQSLKVLRRLGVLIIYSEYLKFIFLFSFFTYFSVSSEGFTYDWILHHLL